MKMRYLSYAIPIAGQIHLGIDLVKAHKAREVLSDSLRKSIEDIRTSSENQWAGGVAGVLNARDGADVLYPLAMKTVSEELERRFTAAAAQPFFNLHFMPGTNTRGAAYEMVNPVNGKTMLEEAIEEVGPQLAVYMNRPEVVGDANLRRVFNSTMLSLLRQDAYVGSIQNPDGTVTYVARKTPRNDLHVAIPAVSRDYARNLATQLFV